LFEEGEREKERKSSMVRQLELCRGRKEYFVSVCCFGAFIRLAGVVESTSFHGFGESICAFIRMAGAIKSTCFYGFGKYVSAFIRVVGTIKGKGRNPSFVCFSFVFVVSDFSFQMVVLERLRTRVFMDFGKSV